MPPIYVCLDQLKDGWKIDKTSRKISYSLRETQQFSFRLEDIWPVKITGGSCKDNFSNYEIFPYKRRDASYPIMSFISRSVATAVRWETSPIDSHMHNITWHNARDTFNPIFLTFCLLNWIDSSWYADVIFDCIFLSMFLIMTQSSKAE